MRKTALLIAALLLVAPLAAYADGAATYNAKCKMCHGADGKKLAKADFSKPEADLVKFLTTEAKHKPRAGDEATAKAIVAYIKTLR